MSASYNGDQGNQLTVQRNIMSFPRVLYLLFWLVFFLSKKEKLVVDIGTLTLCCLSCKAFCDTSLIGRCRIFLFSNNKYVAVK